MVAESIIYRDEELSLDIPIYLERINETNEIYHKIENKLGIKPDFDEDVAKKTGIPLELTAHYFTDVETYKDIIREIEMILGVGINKHLLKPIFCEGVTYGGIPFILNTTPFNEAISYLVNRVVYNLNNEENKLHEIDHSIFSKFSNPSSTLNNGKKVLSECTARASTTYNLEDVLTIFLYYDDGKDNRMNRVANIFKTFHNHNVLSDSTNIFEATAISSDYSNIEAYNKDISKILKNTDTSEYKSYVCELHNYAKSWPWLLQVLVPDPLKVGYLAYSFIVPEVQMRTRNKDKENDFSKFVKEIVSEL